ncbi:MAG TPA: DUF5715 family protein [Acidobacteriaceae bacterium]|jgi:hypothetical protein|nr:DUF5715 family protein [Acidobacteriaceae bacterium]
MLWNSAASRFMTMRRLKNNSFATRAITMAPILLGLAMPALATTTHRSRHAAVAAKAPAEKTASRHTATHAHTQTVAAKSARTHTRTAAVKKPIKQETAHAAPIVEKPSQADFEAAARVHAWETSQHTAASGSSDTASAAAPAATQPAAPIVEKATSTDFIRAAQPQSIQSQAGNQPPAAAPAPNSAATPAPRPARDSVRGPRNSQAAGKAAPQPLTPAVAKMLPGSERETTPALADAEAQVSPMIAPAMVPLLYNRRGRLIMPAALKGSHDILVHQNEMADSEGLDRIQDDDDLARKVADRELVPLPVSSMLRVDERLPENRRYCRPWVAKFLTDIARAHYARFHTPLQVNSAVRTVEFQDQLRRTNGNAAPSDGDTASPHLTGLAVDIAKKPLSHTEIAWMRGYLLPLEQQGKIDVEEEFQQACFHMSVYRKYVPGTPGAPRSQPAGSTTNMLATSLQ